MSGGMTTPSRNPTLLLRAIQSGCNNPQLCPALPGCKSQFHRTAQGKSNYRSLPLAAGTLREAAIPPCCSGNSKLAACLTDTRALDTRSQSRAEHSPALIRAKGNSKPGPVWWAITTWTRCRNSTVLLRAIGNSKLPSVPDSAVTFIVAIPPYCLGRLQVNCSFWRYWRGEC